MKTLGPNPQLRKEERKREGRYRDTVCKRDRQRKRGKKEPMREREEIRTEPKYTSVQLNAILLLMARSRKLFGID